MTKEPARDVRVEGGDVATGHGISPGKRTLSGAVQRKARPPAEASAPSVIAAPLDHGDHVDPFGLHLEAAPVQREAAPASGASDVAVHEAARHGTSGSGGALPHAAAIQRSFGSYDVSGIRSHTDEAAARGTAAMGANAFASGNDVAFAPGATDLHTAAHEAAHVVQQRAGVQLSGGVGAEGDAYERHADAVADKVVAGQSAEALLAAGPGGAAAAPGGAVQHSRVVQRDAKVTSMGTFTDEQYEFEGTTRLNMTLKFTPGDKVESAKIGLSQSLKDMKEGKANSIDAAARSRKSDDGHAIDRLSDNNNPIYGAPKLNDGEGLDATAQDNNNSKGKKETELNSTKGKNATFQLGHRIKQGNDWDVKDAGLHDGPTIVGGPDSSKEFETVALVLEGPQKDTYLGSVRWGWKKDGEGKLSKVPFDIASMGVPTKEFLGAAAMWNEGTVRGTVVPIADDTAVYDKSGNELYKIDEGTELTQKSPVAIKGVYHLFVEITSEGEHKGETVYVKTETVKDKGDGDDLVELPVPQVKTTTGTAALHKHRLGKGKIKELPSGTRVTVSKKSKLGRSKVAIVDGPDAGKDGWISTSKLSDE